MQQGTRQTVTDGGLIKRAPLGRRAASNLPIRRHHNVPFTALTRRKTKTCRIKMQQVNARY
ncbi:protein of unknown function [Cupriavidus taiwanensis]|nr:protein of unknown function [Cupriavidus taiwanensis]